ncbi:MAG: GMC family oxidoreductase [Betaproteobacteria bacterium]|nr:GMC family oxidoreductase [Betaproteobacteria bacterium]
MTPTGVESASNTAQRDFDAIIVGSGAGGGACAYALTRRQLKVLVLEAGPRFDPARDYPLSGADWETRSFPAPEGSRWEITLVAGETLDPAYSRLRSWNHLRGELTEGDQREFGEYLHVRGVGGSTLHFTGEAHRLHPAAMKMYSRFGVAADWPIDYAELEPYYLAAERLIGAAGKADEGARWRSGPYPLPAHPLSFASRRIVAASRELGWVPNPLGVLSQPFDGRPGCNYCNQCNRGCPRGDKASVEVTFLRQALASGFCVLQSGAQVLRLETGDDERIRRVIYAEGTGAEQACSAPVVMLCGGAVQTPRLLLASTGTHAREGLGNESGQVGRNFMETVFQATAALAREPLGTWRGLPSDIISWAFNAPDGIAGATGGCRLMPFTSSMDLAGPIAYATRVVGGWGKKHRERVAEVFGRAIALGGIAECLPHPQAYVDLDPWRRDRHGMPLARLHLHLDAEAARRQDFMAKKIAEVFSAMNVEAIIERLGSYDTIAASHVFGTCRMGATARDSVVDRHCRSHRWRNLFIVDASVFPSSGGGEAPSLTIEALGLRAADFVADSLARREL